MAGLAPPQPRQKVGNRECAYSFDSPYAEGGLFVNLKTFAGCGRDFVQKDASRSQTVLYAHHRWTKTPKEDVEMSEPTTLGVGVQGGFESEDARYDIVKVRSLAVVSDDVTLIQLPCSDILSAHMLVGTCLDRGLAADPCWALVKMSKTVKINLH